MLGDFKKLVLIKEHNEHIHNLFLETNEICARAYQVWDTLDSEIKEMVYECVVNYRNENSGRFFPMYLTESKTGKICLMELSWSRYDDMSPEELKKAREEATRALALQKEKEAREKARAAKEHLAALHKFLPNIPDEPELPHDMDIS